MYSRRGITSNCAFSRANSRRAVEQRHPLGGAGLVQGGQAEVRGPGADTDGVVVRQVVGGRCLGHGRFPFVQSGDRVWVSWAAARRLAARAVFAAPPDPPVNVASRPSEPSTVHRASMG